MTALLPTLILSSCWLCCGQTVPDWFPKAQSLPPPRGEIIRVGTTDELLAAVDRVPPGGTILLADGQYKLLRPVVLDRKTNIVLRSASGDAGTVILSGKGWEYGDEHDDILHIGRCAGVTIADLSFTDCRSYGIKVEAEHAPKDVHILNCRFRDIGVRAIKGSAAQDADICAVRGSVRGCYFENTKVPPADWLFGGDYIAAIDMMALEDWTFSDNCFRNIKGRNGGGRAAVFIWVRSRRVVVERNLIVNCDRGVAFGNPGKSTANVAGERLVYVSDGIIRNNFVVGGLDCGIELWYADRIKVLNNTIWRPERNWNRGIRIGTGTSTTEIANNLVHGGIQSEGGEAQVHHNLAGRLEGYFEDLPSGNPTLTPAATGALGQGVPLAEVTEDIRGRRRAAKPDLGAWQSDREPDFQAPRLWEYSAPLIAPEVRDSNPSQAQKDPSVVFYGGKWHVFMTVKLPGRSAVEYCSFSTWEAANASPRTLLKVSDSNYYCAPQVFYFRPHQKWYLIYQMGVPGADKMWVAYSTTADIADPQSWTRALPILDGGKDDPRKVGGLDYWIICDAQRAYLFLTSLDGRMWRLWTRLEVFPRGFGHCELALEAKVFEASHTYKLKGLDKYLTVIEENGRRYYKAYLADRLDGEWAALADTADRPFAGWKNIRPAAGVEPWTDNISHGELVRDGWDETLTVDPGNLQFIFQGMWDKDKSGRAYGQFQWRIGMLTPIPAATASK